MEGYGRVGWMGHKDGHKNGGRGTWEKLFDLYRSKRNGTPWDLLHVVVMYVCIPPWWYVGYGHADDDGAPRIRTRDIITHAECRFSLAYSYHVMSLGHSFNPSFQTTAKSRD